MNRSNFLRVALIIGLSSCVVTSLPAQETPNPADKTLLSVELMMPRISSDPLLAQRWRKVFEEFGEAVRIRQPLPSDKPSLEETSRGPFRLVKIIGEIQRDGSLLFPDKTFSPSQTGALEEWLNELRTYGAQGSPAGKPLWGMSETQFYKVYDQLKTPVEKPLLGLPVEEAVANIPLEDSLQLVFHSTAEAVRKNWTDSLVQDEVQGLSSGSVLAYLLSQQGLGFRPLRTPSGDIQLVVQPLQDLSNPWSIGWPFPEDVPRNQLLPSLFEQVEIGVPEAPLSTVLDAIEQRSDVRILVDLRACAEKKIDPDTLLVSYPRKKTALALIISSIVVRSKMTMNYRQDEAGKGFIYIAPFGNYVPDKSRTRAINK